MHRTPHRTPHQLFLLSAPEPSGTSFAVWTATFRNLPEPRQPSAPEQAPEACLLSAIMPSNFPPTLLAICTGTLWTSSTIHLHWNPPQFYQPSAPEPSATLSSICTVTLQNLISHLHWNPPEPHQQSAPKPSRTSSAPEPSRTLHSICPGTIRNLISHLHWNPPEPHQPSALEPSGTSSAICTITLRNLITHLHRNPRNPPDPHQLSAPELSGTSSAICTGTLRILIRYLPRNFISHLHRNPPEPHQPSAPEGSGTLRNLLWNLVLQLHRIAPELFWAKDPIASFAVGEKTLAIVTLCHTLISLGTVCQDRPGSGSQTTSGSPAKPWVHCQLPLLSWVTGPTTGNQQPKVWLLPSKNEFRHFKKAHKQPCCPWHSPVVHLAPDRHKLARSTSPFCPLVGLFSDQVSMDNMGAAKKPLVYHFFPPPVLHSKQLQSAPSHGMLLPLGHCPVVQLPTRTNGAAQSMMQISPGPTPSHRDVLNMHLKKNGKIGEKEWR